MLNHKNIKLKSQARHGGVGAAGLQRDPASSALIGDWDAYSLAVIAQITAPLRLRGTTCRASLD